jgi:LysR family transcriptional regulator, transcriptional activator of the cysJI operon
MDLGQLRVFHQVARLKSFRAAADALFVTPPAVSIKIKQMEERYGLRLFERAGRKVELTDAGEALLGYAEQVFRLVKEADDHLNDLKGGMTGNLRISTGLTVGTYHLAPLINAFSKQFPSVDIQMNVTNKKGVVDGILSLKDDLGFVGNGPFDPNLVAARLWEDELVVITSKSLSFGDKPTILPAELGQQPLIVRERGSGTRECIEESLRRQGVATKTFMELGSDEAIKRAVAVGLGISIVPVGVVENEVKLGIIREYRLKAQRLHLDYFMIYHKDKYISRLIKAFMELTLSHATAHREGTAAAAKRRHAASGTRTSRAKK